MSRKYGEKNIRDTHNKFCSQSLKGDDRTDQKIRDVLVVSGLGVLIALNGPTVGKKLWYLW